MEDPLTQPGAPPLVELLLARVQEHLHDDPRDAVHLARLARAVAERLGGPGSLERRVRAAAHLGNALRASGDLSAADRVFREVRELLGNGAGVGVPVFAEVDRLEGALRRDQKYYTEAERLLSRAALVFKVFGDARALAKTLLKVAFVRFQAADRAGSLSALREAGELVDPEREPRLACYVRHNLISFLCDSGEFREAHDLLEASRDLFQPYFASTPSEKLALEVLWLEGRIARGLGDHPGAETALRTAAEGFGALEIGYDAALVYLDLAEVYLAQGKLQEVERLAAAVEPVLKANDLAEEAVTALALFREAAGHRHLTASVLDQLRHRLHHLRSAGNRGSR